MQGKISLIWKWNEINCLSSYFLRKAREFVVHYGFDGLDLDYEFPDASDKNDFALWVKEIKTEFQPYDLEVRFYKLKSISNFSFQSFLH